MMLRSLMPHIVALSMTHVVLRCPNHMALFAIVVAPTSSEDVMQALTVVGLTSLGCAAFIAMMYGELLLLKKMG